MGTKISLCLIVRNEAELLRRCLSSVPNGGFELLVTDTGSQDSTANVARQFGAKVLSFRWCDDFAAARNQSLRHATGDWVFWLDADEQFDESNRRRAQMLFASLPNANIAYVMKQRSPPAPGSKAATSVDQVRLFRNRPEHRWSYRVHEQILPSLHRTGAAPQWTDIVIDHSGYEDSAVKRRKAERNLRLLLLDHAEHPDEPFILFNLAWAYMELGCPGDALALLERSRALSHTGVSIMPLIFALHVQCLLKLGRRRQALAVCRAGRVRYPADTELLFREAFVLQEIGDLPAAEAALRQLLRSRPGSASDLLNVLGVARGRFVTVNEAMHGHMARHFLAEVLRRQGRLVEAEAEWRRALEEQPDFLPAWQQLGELFLDQGRWDDLDQACAGLDATTGSDGEPATSEAAVLRVQARLARGEHAAARRQVEDALGQRPRSLELRLLHTQVLLQSGDLPAAEHALRDVVARAPDAVAAWCNLVKLLHNQKRLAEAVEVSRAALNQCPAETELRLLHGLLTFELNDVSTAEKCLLAVLEARYGDHQVQAQAARHTLGLLYRRLGRWTDAEAQWRALLAETPTVQAAWHELAELFWEQERWSEWEQVQQQLKRLDSANGSHA